MWHQILYGELLVCRKCFQGSVEFFSKFMTAFLLGFLVTQIHSGAVNWIGLSQHSFISFFTTVRSKVLLHSGETINQTEAYCTSVWQVVD